MSATRDRSQKIAFSYTNFYHLYQKAKTQASGTVLKAHDLAQPSMAQVKVRAYRPVEFMAKRVTQAAERKGHPVLEGLKTNLKSLNSIQERLKFLLSEIEEYSKD